MTGDEINVNVLLERQIATLERNLSQRLNRQDEALKEIKEQTKITNGRVTDLEKARERAQGVMFAFRWVPPTVASLSGAGLTILVMVLTGSIH